MLTWFKSKILKDNDPIQYVSAAGFSVIVVSILLLAVISVNALRGLKESVNEVTEVHFLKAELAYQMRDAIRNRSLLLQRMMLTEDFFLRDELRLEFYENARIYRVAREQILALELDVEEQRLLRALDSRVKDVQQSLREFVSNMVTVENLRSLDKSFLEAVADQKHVLEQLDEWVALQSQRAVTKRYEADGVYDQVFTVSITMSVLVVLVTIIVAFAILRYVTRRNLEMRTHNQQLVKATQVKSEFLATVSHEIRTPLNGIMGMVTMLEDTRLTESQQDYIASLRSCSTSLLDLINELLDFSKLEAHRLSLNQEDFRLDAMIDEVMALLSARAQNQKVEIFADVDQDVPRAVWADSGRLRQVLINLVGNAVKFTEYGEVRLGISLVKQQDNFITLRFDVCDTGIGIKDSEKEKLFEAFSQADGQNTRKYGGTGLGLTISRELVQLMGGEITYFSRYHLGSRFWFTMDCKLAESIDVPEANPVLKDKRVLAIHSNENYLTSLQKVLAGWGMRPTIAINAYCAMSLIGKAIQSGFPYDLILLADKAVHVEARHFVNKAAQLYGINKHDFFILHPLWAARDENTVMEGIAGVISQPVKQSIMHDQLVSALTHESIPVELAASAVEASTDKADTNVTEFSLPMEEHKPEQHEGLNMANVLVVEDNEINQKVITGMLRKLNLNVSVAANGQEAIDILLRKSFDLVFMDCQMPVMDGYEATAKLREMMEQSLVAATPIVALTANASDDDRKKCLMTGMDDFLSKPVKLDLLRKTILKWLGGPDESRRQAIS